MKGLSLRVSSIKPSPTISVSEKARKLKAQGKRLVDLSIGEPDFDTPNHIKDACMEALKRGFTHYTSSKGILELRNSISTYYSRYFNVDVDPSNEVIVTPGSKFALYAAIQSVVDKGDEVLLLTPAWPTYWQCIESAEGRVVEINCGDSFKLNEEDFKNAITSRCKAIVFCSPSNPTGGVLSIDELKFISDMACDHDLYVVSDEIYRMIVYDGLKPYTMLSFDGLRDRLIVVDGFSKAYAMTGWRLGFAIASKDVINAMDIIQQNTTTCPSSFIQYAAISALMGDQSCIDFMVGQYDIRRRFLVEALNSIPGVKCPNPKGAFYVFPDMSKLGLNSMDLSSKLLDYGVVTIPGDAFGPGGEGHLRISYATSMDEIKLGVELIRSFVMSIH
ncbi:MAG: pyridoxal phosphate-dependent aminotransferase [Candidatus Methanomethylicia archaeon]